MTSHTAIKTEEVAYTLTPIEHKAANTLLELASKSREGCLVFIDPTSNQTIIDYKRVYTMDTYRGSTPSLQLVSSTNIDSPVAHSTPSISPSLCTLPKGLEELQDFNKAYGMVNPVTCVLAEAVNYAHRCCPEPTGVNLDRPLFWWQDTLLPNNLAPPPPAQHLHAGENNPWKSNNLLWQDLTMEEEIKQVKDFGGQDQYLADRCNGASAYPFCCLWHYYGFKD